jgi:type II secretory pathway component PulC
MKQSLWILASSSLIIFLCALIFVFFTTVRKPKFQSLKASYDKEISIKKISPEEIVKIYENDLFDTDIPKPVLKKVDSVKLEVPRIPEIVKPSIIINNEVSFLEPIPYTLVGTVVSPNDTESIAVVSDNRTKKESSYFVGDELDDAQVLDISYKSITLIRSNGQKETLFLPGFDKILKKFNSADKRFARMEDIYNFVIDPDLFINKIRSLGNLISNLNIITAYKDGISIGCKIGNILEDSIASSIGLEKGDIVLQINGLPLATLDQRLDAYNQITGLKKGDSIVINLIRENQEIQLKYILDKLDNEINFIGSSNNFNPLEPTSKLIKDDLERRYKFAPTIAEIKENEREAIIKQLNKKIS